MTDAPPSENGQNRWKQWKQGLPTWTGALVALVLLVVFTALLNPTFLKPENLFNILRQWSFVGIIAIGMTFVIIQGGIDLSVGSLLAFLGGLGILGLNGILEAGAPEGVAVLCSFGIMLAVGALAGGLNGILITRGRLAPFIATLGGLAAYRSLALAMVDGGEYRSRSDALFARLGAGGIPVPGTNMAPRAPEPIPLLVPWPVIVFLLIALIAHILLTRTRYGRYVIAIGCNERAAVYSAINVDRIKLLTYTFTGFVTGVSAMLLASRMNSVSSSGTGLLYELDVIAAVVIGGTRMRGGAGTIAGTVIGVLILGVVGNMLNLLQVSPYLQGLVKGVIIIGAVLVQRRGRE